MVKKGRVENRAERQHAKFSKNLGVQIIQELGPDAKSLSVFHRTPNFALPMRRKILYPEGQNRATSRYPELYDLRERYFGGFAYEWDDRNTLSNTPEARETFWESLW
ncbi:hypothetical protein N7532_011064 [Penicillium argentinense]|uniref:Uncharacterized protein n=1 Tax=Penicillium argentinense TaxID=1131581 RepID=A0A9W9JUK5_9EURO|nr:uncharacterized protein N7532_011064 [Penicillium argentinense]KAJ5082021.1 hypothetical protein N7532_011064 [Penicillium argentinense]